MYQFLNSLLMMTLISLQDVFKFDPNYLENEEKYKVIKTEILGEDSDETESGSGSEESSDDDDEEGSHYAISRII